ncbi:MAG: aminotransferase class V-fold PLP-dependent enzyme [Desulfobacterales bacterium]|nr:aminotransferase class V-fold PLP-dependent enzyme [Desulfobacterales bacterium]
MQVYPIPMVPGPVKVPEPVLTAYQVNYGSADLEPEFFELYNRCEENLQQIMATKNRVVIASGEGMLALWGALKSCLMPGDRVLSIATGVFGDGIGDMAKQVGAEVKKISFSYDRTLSDLKEVETAIGEFQPKMITAVHCETPSGTLNPLAELGALKKELKVPLFYVDAVSSIGGAPVLTDAWHIDLCLGGSQKCLSSLPDLSFIAVSDRAWKTIEQVGYAGYDALSPFRSAQADRFFPYTPNWQGISALNTGAELILDEGLEDCFSRHEAAADLCRKGLEKIGIDLFPAAEAVCSPTVTAANVPENISWADFDARLRAEGLAVAGSYGPMAGRVFRIGHMGSQADEELVRQALSVIAKAARGG